MAKQELLKPSLIGEIKNQVRLNLDRGDTKSLNGHGWDAYGVDISNYEESFSAVLKGSVYDLLKDNPFPKVVDIMGPSKAISTLFEKFQDKPKLGLAVSLDDLRSDQQKERDKSLNVKQISGDILRSSTWRAIEQNLQGHKTDLLMERAYLGLDCIPAHPRLYAMLLNKAWSLLSKENGVLLFGIPFEETIEQETDINIGQWIDSLQRNSIDALIGKSLNDWDSYIKMVKTPNSPEKLPFLK